MCVEILFDLRMPAIALGPVGLRKRYVFFAHSVANLQKTAVCFDRVPYAPSEESVAMAATPVPGESMADANGAPG